MTQAAAASVVPASCSSGGCSAPEADTDLSRCPVSRTPGSRVALITLKALLKGHALRRLEGKAYRFCPEPGCDVVYFDREAGSVFDKRDLEVRVGQKESDETIPICYCFGVSLEDLRRGIADEGETDIPARIEAEVRAGHCACEVKNPQGICCLGNVSRALTRIRFEAVSPRG